MKHHFPFLLVPVKQSSASGVNASVPCIPSLL